MPMMCSMATLRYTTAGESHGPQLTTIVEGLPAGVPVRSEIVDEALKRRQGGYGRGGRQRIETDIAEWVGGVRLGHTTGAPVAIRIPNRDSRLDDLERTPPVHRPRPGHADLAGAIKTASNDCRETLERASARETASRTAAGALARCMLRELGIEVVGFVRSLLDVRTDAEPTESGLKDFVSARDASDVACPDEQASAQMIERIRQAKVDKDTVGGVAEVHVFGCPIGLGSFAQWHTRLDSRLGAAVLGIQAFKGVEVGLGFGVAGRPGSQVHDPILPGEEGGYPQRASNNAGGIEGGMTNGQPVVVRGAMKPISTLLRGLPSVDLRSGEALSSDYERSDVCALPAASVVMEQVVAFEIACVLREKFGGDSLEEVQAQLACHDQLARQKLGLTD